MFLLTFEFLGLLLEGMFLSTAMASPLIYVMNIEGVKNNEPSRSSCLKHTVAQSKVAVLTAGKNYTEEVRQRKTRVALVSTRPTNKQLRV